MHWLQQPITTGYEFSETAIQLGRNDASVLNDGRWWTSQYRRVNQTIRVTISSTPFSKLRRQRAPPSGYSNLEVVEGQLCNYPRKRLPSDCRLIFDKLLTGQLEMFKAAERETRCRVVDSISSVCPACCGVFALRPLPGNRHPRQR